LKYFQSCARIISLATPGDIGVFAEKEVIQ
jgi:hypothetical protein